MMLRMSGLSIAITCLTLTMGAAAAATSPAMGACTHPAVLTTVLSLVRENSGAGPLMADAESRRAALLAFSDGTAPLTLHAVRTVARDDRLGRSGCDAVLRISLPPATFAKLAGNLIAAASLGAAGWARDAGANTASVTVQYASQPTDDRRDAVVELAAARQVGSAAGLMAVAATAAKREAAAPAAVDRCADLSMSSTYGLQLCANRQFQDADNQLNAAYKTTLARLTPARVNTLRAEQRAWLARLRPECEAEQEALGIGGTAATLNVTGCVTQRTADRAQQIAAMK